MIFSSYLIFNRNIQFLQILISRTAAVINLILSCLGTDGIGCSIEEFEVSATRKIFTFGVQTDKAWKRVTSPPICCSSFHLARISSDVASKTLYTILSLNEDAIPIGSGKTVTSPMFATPCSASLHHWNLLIPIAE